MEELQDRTPGDYIEYGFQSTWPPVLRRACTGWIPSLFRCLGMAA